MTASSMDRRTCWPSPVRARQQRGADRLGAGVAGQLVGQDGAHQPRPRLVGAGLHGGQPAQALDQRVEHRLGGKRTVEAEAGDGDEDELRVQRAQRLGVEAEARDRAGTEVLDEHIGRGGEPLQRRDAAGRLQVEHDRALVAVVVQERGGEPAAPPRDMAGVVARRRLDLDHVGALVGQDHGGQRSRDHRGEIDDPVSVERSWHGGSLPVRSPQGLFTLR